MVLINYILNNAAYVVGAFLLIYLLLGSKLFLIVQEKRNPPDQKYPYSFGHSFVDWIIALQFLLSLSHAYLSMFAGLSVAADGTKVALGIIYFLLTSCGSIMGYFFLKTTFFRGEDLQKSLHFIFMKGLVVLLNLPAFVFSLYVFGSFILALFLS